VPDSTRTSREDSFANGVERLARHEHDELAIHVCAP
jgi:hypothetical protein